MADSQLPADFQPLFGAEQIAEQVQCLGAQVDAWAEDVRRTSQSDILAIPILRGAIFFFADLMRRIEHSVEIAPARSWGYDKDANSRKSELAVNLQDVPAKGRALLLVDDICDSGRTLHLLKETLLQSGAQCVKSVVLVKRVLAQETFEPDWVGFRYHGLEWLVGYGMDTNDRWRNLPAIYAIKKK